MEFSRKEDLTLIIAQDNLRKSLEVHDAEEGIEHLIGYKADELRGMALSDILPEHVQEVIAEDLEYDADGTGLDDILSDMSHFGLQGRMGQFVRCSLKVMRDVSEGSRLHYQMRLHRMRLSEVLNDEEQQVFTNLYGFEDIDPVSNLPNFKSFIKALELVAYKVKQHDIEACLAIIMIDQAKELAESKTGKEALRKAYASLAEICQSHLREEDHVGAIKPGEVGAILLEAQPANAKIPLNRLRWMYATKTVEDEAGETIPLTFTATFAAIDGKTNPQELVKTLEKRIKQAENNGKSGNCIVE